MSETTVGLRRKIRSASDLHSVVRAMKAMASSNIVRYEQAVQALEEYAQSVNLGLGLALREAGDEPAGNAGGRAAGERAIGVIVLGSDQGLVGQFNEAVAERAQKFLADLPQAPVVWAMGERVQGFLQEADLEVAGLFPAPNTVEAITPLIGRILAEIESRLGYDAQVHLFHNCHNASTQCDPRHLQLLPLDRGWRQRYGSMAWPTKILPEIAGDSQRTLRALVREYVFVSLFRACAESLAGENASRLAAMQRAEKNIEELLADMSGAFHRLRQAGIDAELFDVIAGFEALTKETASP
ncbi:MAG: F0F1 ATP synthase subunit gamma [Desulfomicrobium sp.]|nr:F0F1 ATP synthase subunit gamma [Pseudomonadota bacterium]MBV1713771.1 F0F1 ATP synthase subunit gamma [Desulfomicrobium sp.]MBU4572306.1 F0F1 ATP synthase subunit gamma [Pseudomonadota bacterium]MBU4594284.1 F0F1 ATP synthase subunit gamma [Pseudomonadota bacterium]MBV1719453.1 F0F1 ATP synthase subunit gamma [Desulfomicrobium sp.]